MNLSRFRRSRPAAGACVGACAAALAFALVACSEPEGETDTSGTAGATSAAESRYTTPLRGICPDTVVVQTSWWSGVAEGFLYQLLGPNPVIDREGNRVTGPLGGTGVALEIRAGGPAVGFQPVPSLLAQDEDILLGNVDLDEAIQTSGSQPTVSVFSSFDKAPLILLWGDPAWEFTSAAEVGRSGAPVLASEGAYVDVLVHEGILDASNVDTSYQGSPDRFVAADGKIVQVGFVTSEPYRYEHDVPEWGKPVDFLLLHDEYPVYMNTLATRQDTLEANRECLSGLVPLLQQAQRDYAADPAQANQILLDAVETLDTGGFTLSPGLLADGNAKQAELGLVADGGDGVLGSFDTIRVQELIDRLTPVFADQDAEVNPELTPAELVTNEFLDASVSLD